MVEASDSRWQSWGCLVLVLIVGVGILFFAIPTGTRFLRERAAVEQAHEISLLLFAYNEEHKAYPTGRSSTEVFQKLLDEHYVDDPDTFYFPMPGKVKPVSSTLRPENVCWDVTSGLMTNDPDEVPLVFATGYRMNYVPGGSAVPLKGFTPKLRGQVIAYKSMNVIFCRDDGTSSRVVPNAISPSLGSSTNVWRQITPVGPLPPP